MNNSIILLIILFCGAFSLIYFLLYKMLRKRLVEIREYIENNGKKTEAEVMGYAQVYSYKTKGKCPVLKFKDNMGIEHIVETSGDGLLKYNKGDILNINYIETEKLPDRLRLSESLDKRCENKNINVKLYNKYFEKPYEEILLTDNDKKFEIIIKDKPTRPSYYMMLLILFAPAIFWILFCSVTIKI